MKSIHTQLGHHDIGFKGLDQWRNDLLECHLVKIIIRSRPKRAIDRKAHPFSSAYFIHKTASWKEGPPILVNGDGQDLVGLIEGLLYPIPVMSIYIEIDNTLPAFQKLQNADDRVVDVTESGGPCSMGMVKPSGDVEGNRHILI